MDSRQNVDMLDIIRHDAEVNGENFDEIYDFLSKGIEQGVFRILRFGNTLGIYHIISQGVADLHIATLDNEEDLLQALMSFYHAFQKAGFTRLVLEDEEPKVMQAIKMAQIPVREQESEEGMQMTIEVK